MVQIDGPKRHAYIKFCDNNRLQEVLHLTKGQVEYRHTNGEISIVRLEPAGLGVRKVRIANLPPGSVECGDTNGAVQLWGSEGRASRDVVSLISLLGGEWHSYRNDHYGVL
jgi:hypothetical protein